MEQEELDRYLERFKRTTEKISQAALERAGVDEVTDDDLEDL